MTIVVDAAYPASGHPVPNVGPALLPDWRHPLLPLPSSTSRRTVALAGWSILAIGLAFAEAIARLGARALAGVRGGLSPAEWVALAASVLLFTWFEGYRSLHRRWVPAAVRRAFEVAARSAGVLGWLAAPLKALGLLGGTRRELVRAWVGVGMITLAVFLVRALPMPWRAIVDAGVSSALLLGLCSLVIRFIAAAKA
ncbi:MAG TPA: hypothetical protein VIG99_17065 [Myxococcaceae bacterium]|jgi:hypothetical protein